MEPISIMSGESLPGTRANWRRWGWGKLVAININASLADYDYYYLVNKLSLAIMKMLSGANP